VVEKGGVEIKVSALMTYDQAAEYLAVSTKTLRRWVAERKIPVIIISRKLVRFRKEDLDRFISKHYQKALEG